MGSSDDELREKSRQLDSCLLTLESRRALSLTVNEWPSFPREYPSKRWMARLAASEVVNLSIKWLVIKSHVPPSARQGLKECNERRNVAYSVKANG